MCIRVWNGSRLFAMFVCMCASGPENDTKVLH